MPSPPTLPSLPSLLLPARLTLCSLLASLSIACAGQPSPGPRRVVPDELLIFEQRRASAPSGPTAPAWETWQLYESGRFVYAHAGAEASQRHVDVAQLREIHAWLRQHDFELLRNSPERMPPRVPGVSASCQLHLSTGLTLAPLGDPRYYACDALKQLSTGPR